MDNPKDCEVIREECDFVPIVDISSVDTYIEVEYKSPDTVVVSASNRLVNLMKKLQSLNAEQLAQQLKDIEDSLKDLEETVPGLTNSVFKLRRNKADKQVVDKLVLVINELKEEVAKLKKKHYVLDTFFADSQKGKDVIFNLPDDILEIAEDELIGLVSVFKNGLRQTYGVDYLPTLKQNLLTVNMIDGYTKNSDIIYITIGYLKEIK